MNIRSAKFIKSAVGTDELLENDKPQVAFFGRSNAGKSSVINSLTGQKELARTSSFPGRTQQLNIFLINKSLYLVDLPGYGFAKISREAAEGIQKMITWYLFKSGYEQRAIVLIIDAEVGPTKLDMEIFYELRGADKKVIIVANKVDKIKKAEYEKKMEKINNAFAGNLIIPYSSKTKTGVSALTLAILEE
jgi:GTP-binding protein